MVEEGLRAFSYQKGYVNNRISINQNFGGINGGQIFSQVLRKWIKWQYV